VAPICVAQQQATTKIHTHCFQNSRRGTKHHCRDEHYLIDEKWGQAPWTEPVSIFEVIGTIRRLLNFLRPAFEASFFDRLRRVPLYAVNPVFQQEEYEWPLSGCHWRGLWPANLWCASQRPHRGVFYLKRERAQLASQHQAVIALAAQSCRQWHPPISRRQNTTRSASHNCARSLRSHGQCKQSL
jgi:hypothetical protein